MNQTSVPQAGFHATSGEDKEQAERIKRMFTSLVPRNDLANFLLSMGRDRSGRRRVARQMAPGPGERALDLACGTGELTRKLLQGGGQVVGADFTHAMLVKARSVPGRPLLLADADALALPFPDETFQQVTVAFGVRNFADLGQGLAEIRRVLKSGGCLGVLEFSRPQGILGFPARLYVKHLLPVLGRIITGRAGPYGYLASTISRWPAPSVLAQFFRDAGFHRVTWARLTGGVAVLHTAWRP
ncbi:MAG: ubiquinone/menaquinone biosynthesis methyltransferase [Acidobacteriota bacterium]